VSPRTSWCRCTDDGILPCLLENEVDNRETKEFPLHGRSEANKRETREFPLHGRSEANKRERPESSHFTVGVRSIGETREFPLYGGSEVNRRNQRVSTSRQE